MVMATGTASPQGGQFEEIYEVPNSKRGMQRAIVNLHSELQEIKSANVFLKSRLRMMEIYLGIEQVVTMPTEGKAEYKKIPKKPKGKS